MDFMSILQKGSLVVIILIFLGIGGSMLYTKYTEYKVISAAKHKKLLKELEKEDKA